MFLRNDSLKFVIRHVMLECGANAALEVVREAIHRRQEREEIMSRFVTNYDQTQDVDLALTGALCEK
jgi:hypothetical protein